MTVVTKLDKATRDALADDQFAFPRLRKAPLHDEHHIKLAWGMIDGVQGADPAERIEARRLTLNRAKEIGVDTREWHRLKSVKMMCMSLDISQDEHPNKMPFSGVLTKLDEPSDVAPNGSNGKRIMVTSAAARAALGTLLGMAVDFTSSFDGHDPQAKIGIITSANVVGNDLVIEGFVYAADFPDTADLIKKLKDDLGFSFEAQRLTVEDMSAEVLTINELVFTGAAILLKDKAAYQTTSLAASAILEELNMSPEDFKTFMADVLKPVTDRLAQLEAGTGQVTVEAKAATMSMVEPHCSALEACAKSMSAAGIGNDTRNGHTVVLQRMANSMRADAAMGRIPHSFSDYGYYASADDNIEDIDMKPEELAKLVNDSVNAALDARDKASKESNSLAAQIQSAVDTALAPVQAQLKEANDKLAAAETKLKDAEALRVSAAASPTRKTLPPQVTALLSRANLSLPEGDGKLNVGEIDKALAGANLSIQQRIMVKNQLERVGAVG